MASAKHKHGARQVTGKMRKQEVREKCAYESYLKIHMGQLICVGAGKITVSRGGCVGHVGWWVVGGGGRWVVVVAGRWLVLGVCCGWWGDGWWLVR